MPRLNLRTLLAYLDDALEPAQAKLIGERIAESEQAQELIERIKQVTRRRRLTTPPEAAKIDPNTIAEFLDNSLSAEQQAEVEDICLASDVHLAEVAACHQILANAKGEPTLVPPTAKQRMYLLTQEPEVAAAGASRPVAPAAPSNNGEPAFNLVSTLKRHKSYVLLGGGLIGGIVLAVAISQVLQFGNTPRGDQVAKGPEKVVPEKKEPVVPPKKVEQPESKKTPEKTEDPKPAPKPPEVKVEKKIEEPKRIEPPPMIEATFPALAPPSRARVQIAAFQTPDMNQPAILLQAGDQKDDWRRLEITKPEVFTAQPLVSLPGCRSTVLVQGGVRLTLWGNLTEMIPILIHESLVVLHQNPELDADLTLKRGRIVLANTHDRPALVRVRFANPTNPDAKDCIDIRLLHKGSEVLIDRFSRFPVNEKFYPDPKNPNRAGPVADMGVVVLNGELELKFNDVTFGMQAPPGRSLLMWNSQSGLGGATALDKLPDFVSPSPPLFKGLDGKARNEMLRARDELSTILSGKAVELGLREARESPDRFKRQLAVRCFGALDDVGNLLDSLEDKQPDVRAEGVLTTRHWIAAERDNDYLFFDALKTKYTPLESEKIMELMHNISERQMAAPETYEFLIEALDNPRLILRELAKWHLYALAPAGQNIPYSAAGDAASRQKAQAAWRQVIPAGQLPKTK